MKDTGTKKHAELAEEFIKDREKADWHDGALWWIRQKRDIQANKTPQWKIYARQHRL